MSALTKPKISLRSQCVLGGAAIGAAAFLLLYGFAPIAFSNDTWLRGGFVEKDTLQHYAGWLFYRQSPWGWPLGLAQNIGGGGGTYVGFTDSIPLFALLFKLLSPILPATFQYFGLWGFLCSVLQGASAALLLSLFSQSRLRIWLLCPLFTFAPIFLDRLLRHGALGAQWLILFSIYLYFKHRRSGRFFSPGFLALAALSISIHPYLTPMVYALLFALLLENGVALCRQGGGAWRGLWRPAAMLAGAFAATLLVGWVLGAFSGGTGGGSTPYGFFSMNLTAPFNPRGMEGFSWSLFLPEQNLTLGNYDGFNYLGLGVLLCGVIIAADMLIHVRQIKKWPLWAFVRRHFGVLLVCLFLTVFAVSNTVTARGAVWFTVPLPQAFIQLAGTFRSSGRMFYPVWYLLLLCACVYCLHRPPPKWRSWAVGALVAVQLLDLSPALWAKAQVFRPYQAVEASPLQSPLWQQLAGEYTRLASLDGTVLAAPADLALYAADSGMATTDAFAARFDVATHDALVEEAWRELVKGRPREDTLYITSVESRFWDLASVLSSEMFCAQVDGLWYVLAPYTDGFTGYEGPGVVPFADYPFTIEDYSDALWDHGVLTSDRRVVCFLDFDYARRQLEGASAIRAGGVTYPILEISYDDVGWILVTLDTKDATPLQGAALEMLP